MPRRASKKGNLINAKSALAAPPHHPPLVEPLRPGPTLVPPTLSTRLPNLLSVSPTPAPTLLFFFALTAVAAAGAANVATTAFAPALAVVTTACTAALGPATAAAAAVGVASATAAALQVLLRMGWCDFANCFRATDRLLLDSLAASCQFELAVGGTSEALRVAVLPIREGKCLPVVFAPNGQ